MDETLALAGVKVYLFEWSNGPDEGPCLVSVHWTKRGAHKARMQYANEAWWIERNRCLVWGKVLGLDPLHFCHGRVREVKVAL